MANARAHTRARAENAHPERACDYPLGASLCIPSVPPSTRDKLKPGVPLLLSTQTVPKESQTSIRTYLRMPPLLAVDTPRAPVYNSSIVGISRVPLCALSMPMQLPVSPLDNSPKAPLLKLEEPCVTCACPGALPEYTNGTPKVPLTTS